MSLDDFAQHDGVPRTRRTRHIAGSTEQSFVSQNCKGQRFLGLVGDAEVGMRQHLNPRNFRRQGLT